MIKFLNKHLHTPSWLFFLALAVLILRIPTLFEPYSYGDEMIYLTLGEGMRQGIPLYSGIHDNKPPLLYLMAAIAGNLFWFRAILAIWHIATIYLFYKLSTVLFPKNERFQQVSTLIFTIFTTLPFWEGNIANAEIFMIGPTLAAFLILSSVRQTPFRLFSAGLLFSVATLFKLPAIFDVTTIMFLWLISIKSFRRENLIVFLQKCGYLLAGLILPIFLTFIWYFFQGALKDYITAAYLQNIGYLSSFRPGDVQKPFLVRNLPLLIRGLVMLSGLTILYWKRNKLSKQFIFATSWSLFALFAITLSERPYPHYLIQVVPAIAILGGMFFTIRNIEQIWVIIPLTLIFFVPKYYHFWGYPTLSYYSRFINLVTAKIDKDTYINSFGGNVGRSYKISQYLTSSSTNKDKVLVWGDSSLVYALSKRLPPIKYVAGYHIKDFYSTEQLVQKSNEEPPLFVVFLPDEKVPAELENFIKRNYAQVEIIDGATIWKLLGPKVKSLMDSQY